MKKQINASSSRLIMRHASRAGFTLLEIVVSITLLMLMALLLARVFSESDRAVRQGKDQASLDETARLLLDLIEQDVSQALVRTNVAFRVGTTTDPNDTLYFVSTGMRRQQETIRRDTAPMRIQAVTGPDGWSRILEIQSPDNASIDANLAAHSDYYFNPTHLKADDFKPVHAPSQMMATHAPQYTQPLDTALQDHAVLTFLEFTVNGDQNWPSKPDEPPDPANMPRFVDVAIGLVSATEMNTAMLKNNEQHYRDQEVVFTRRIFLRNTGIGPLAF